MAKGKGRATDNRAKQKPRQANRKVPRELEDSLPSTSSAELYEGSEEGSHLPSCELHQTLICMLSRSGTNGGICECRYVGKPTFSLL